MTRAEQISRMSSLRLEHAQLEREHDSVMLDPNVARHREHTHRLRAHRPPITSWPLMIEAATLLLL